MTRLGTVLLLAAVACEAAPRVFDASCAISARRSSRGQVACVMASGCTPVPTPTGSEPASPNDFNTAPWTTLNSGAAAPTVTNAAAAGPDCGASSASTIALPAVTAGQYSGVYQPNGCRTLFGNVDQSVYVKGVTVGGTISMCSFSLAPSCVDCVFTATAFTKCARTNVNTGATGDFFLGYVPTETGGVAGPAVTVAVWGSDCVDPP